MRIIFEWDVNKAKSNQHKHKITFDEAKSVFSDPLAFTFLDEDHSSYEDRFLTIGFSISSRLLLVVHTETNRIDGNDIIIRIISCRLATKEERKVYEEQ